MDILHFRYTGYLKFVHTVVDVSPLEAVLRGTEFLANQSPCKRLTLASRLFKRD
jgi:hypothetical protein